MGERRKLDENSTGISFQDRVFMVVGYLDEYKYPTGFEEVLEENTKTIHDFKDNKGYVDADGQIQIYKEKVPGKAFDAIPWFTIEVNNDEQDASKKYKIKTNPKKSSVMKSMWTMDRIKDLSVQNIINNTTTEPLKYDEKVMMTMARATSVVKPVVEATDDFLKAIVKTTINAKNVNVNKYKAKISPTWIVSNLINGLVGKTKTGPVTFQSWMEMLGCNFEVRIYDNGQDPEDPLKHVLVYNSESNKITEETEEGEKNDKEDVRVARSVDA